MPLADRGITHGMRYQARTLAPLFAASDRSSWLAGTTALREENEVEVLEFDAEADTLKRTSSYRHGPEVWSIAPSPDDQQRLITVFNDGGSFGATLWKANNERGSLEAAAQLSEPPAPAGRSARILSALWWEGCKAATVEEAQLRCWQLGEAEAQETGSLKAEQDAPMAGGACGPSDRNRLASIAGCSIQLWDVRTMESSGGVSHAAKEPLLDCHFAPVTPHVLSAVGEDGQLRVWDLRRTGSGPLLSVGGNTRWVWRVRHNPVHDSLVITSSADRTVGLHYFPGMRAAVTQGRPMTASTSGRAQQNGRVHTADDHEEAVYGAEWSVADPWVFASLSYDGRVVVNRVPSPIKYKILI